MKNFRIFHLKTFIFLVVKFSVYLNKLVLVMSLVSAAITFCELWWLMGAWFGWHLFADSSSPLLSFKHLGLKRS